MTPDLSRIPEPSTIPDGGPKWRCATCRWWGKADPGTSGDWSRYREGLKGCGKPNSWWGWASDGVPAEGPVMFPTANDDYGAGLLTSAEFGCVLWEDKAGEISVAEQKARYQPPPCPDCGAPSEVEWQELGGAHSELERWVPRLHCPRHGPFGWG